MLHDLRGGGVEGEDRNVEEHANQENDPRGGREVQNGREVHRLGLLLLDSLLGGNACLALPIKQADGN